MEGVRPIPPNDFCRKLYWFDPDLRITWDDHIGCWQIWHHNRSTQELSHVMNVIENDGTYRPLDDRVFQILTMNRWYAEHPEALEHEMVDGFIENRENDEKRMRDDLKHIAKDSALRKRFDKVREMAGFVDKREWTTQRSLYGPDGKPITNAEGREIQYVPHKSLND